MSYLSIQKKIFIIFIFMSLLGCQQKEVMLSKVHNSRDDPSSDRYYSSYDTKDVMTDEITNNLWIASKFNLYKVTLNIQCSKNKTTMYFDWMDWYLDHSADRSPEGELLLRIDDNKAFKVNIIDDVLKTKIINPVRVIKKMIKGDYLIIRKGNELIPFNIENLDKSIKDIRDNCNW